MPKLFRILFSNTVKGHAFLTQRTLPIIVHIGAHTYQGTVKGAIKNAARFVATIAAWKGTKTYRQSLRIFV